ncbi:riboflavin synthase [Geomicrobium sp. JCM 19039]|uniref:riboflavin synthase n=1 Tax=Geomicrobium sp. JCM 19039 TaxID=1460636 RepID=UPI00045F16FD|nr:riboflavin synthase [Geomicrobium sp. JCM 19039]GAK13576.1 riboflavin synthase [Geomicrobium sp. JCM 19039]
MFTGIVEEVARLISIEKKEGGCSLEIEARTVTEDVRIGDSISVSGVCLTVTSYNKQSFTVDVMEKTMEDTTMGTLEVDAPVNVERAVQAGGRFDGHIVTGHVDGVGQVTNREEKRSSTQFTITLPEKLMRYMIMKGSVAVDGTSLTIFAVEENEIKISIIPHTHKATKFAFLHEGDAVNIECDMVAKYIEKFTEVNDEKHD